MCLFLRDETLALLEMRRVALQNSFGKTAEAIAIPSMLGYPYLGSSGVQHHLKPHHKLAVPARTG